MADAPASESDIRLLVLDRLLIRPSVPPQGLLEKFVASLEARRGGRAALNKLYSIAKKTQNGGALASHVLKACYLAERYDSLEEHSAKQRAQDRRFAKRVPALAKLFRSVAAELKKDRTQFDLVISNATLECLVALYLRPVDAPVAIRLDQGVAGAMVRLGVDGAAQVTRFGNLRFAESIPDCNGYRSSYGLERLCVAIAEQLERHGSPMLGRGPYMHRFSHGPLLFGKPVDKSRTVLPDVSTMLHFNLAFLFRLFTSGETDWSTGQQMPTTGGRPHWKAVAALANVTLKRRDSHESACDRVRKLIDGNPGIGLTDWPNK